MKKLKLNLNELNVESLCIPANPNPRGTVAGQALQPEWEQDEFGLLVTSKINDTVLRNTEWLSCGGTCGTCGGTDCWA